MQTKRLLQIYINSERKKYISASEEKIPKKKKKKGKKQAVSDNVRWFSINGIEAAADTRNE